jgi:MFS family permease
MKFDARISAMTVGLGTMVVGMQASAVAASLPEIARHTGMGMARSPWVLVIYTLVLSSSMISLGRLGDAVGYKPVYLAGLTLFTVASGFIGISTSFPVMIALRALQGAGAAMVSATSLALLAHGRVVREYGDAIAWQTAMTYAGLALGPIAAGCFLQRFGWRAIFLINLPAGLIAILVARHVLQDPLVNRRSLHDWKLNHCLGWIAVIAPLVLALSFVHRGSSFILRFALPTLMMAAALVFKNWRQAIVNTLIPAGTKVSRDYWRIPATEILCYLCLYGVAFLMPFYLIDNHRVPFALAGYLLSSQYIARGLAALCSGYSSSRLGIQNARLAGMAILAITLLGLAQLNVQSSALLIALLLAGVGVGTGIFVPANSQAIMSCTPAEIQGTATAILATARNLGMTLGVPIAAAMYGRFRNTESNSIRSSMLVLSSLAFVNVLLCGFVQSSGAPQRAALLIQPSNR